MYAFSWIGASLDLGGLTTLKSAVTIGLFVIFGCWQAWLPFFPLRDLPRHALRNVTVALLNTVVLGLAFGSAIVLTADWTLRHQVGLLNFLEVGEAARLVLALLSLDFWTYGWHRLNHAVPLLWRCHRMHHADDRMDVTTATRFHLGELAASALLRLGLTPLLGFTIEHLILYDSLLLAVTLFHHANLSIGRCDHWLGWLIVTPFLHKVHHSRWRPRTDSNFASVLSLWDRLFGTLRERDDPTTIRFGLDDFSEEKWQTIGGMLITPFRCDLERSALFPDALRQVDRQRHGGEAGEDASQNIGERDAPTAQADKIERLQFKR
jgi:sterol desaturase/sphingolipid hydroxylase (fatty acid hydroxylase superfamily)